MKIAFTLVIVLLFLGCVGMQSSGSDYLVVDGLNMTLSDLEDSCGVVEVAGNEGIPLECVVLASGLQDPENHTYALIGSDGYQKTVNWEDMEKGALTSDKMVVFPHLSKGFWVKDVYEVEVGG